MGDSSITVTDYLLERLVQIGVTHIFGVPGDFNLVFLDSIEDHPKLTWVGCCNELNAAYAADGFARTQKDGLGVLLTTFGVGELSAVNGVAGSFAEHVPVLHLVGTPSTKLQSKHAILHHTLGTGQFLDYASMAEHVAMAQVLLRSPEQAADGIDRAIRVALQTSRPTYLTLPTDLVTAKISSKPLEQRMTARECISSPSFEPASDKSLQHAVAAVVALYEKAQRPMVLIDACAVRFGVQQAALDLIEATGMPYVTSPMGKGAIDEAHPKFSGIYVGDISHPAIRDLVSSSDLIICVGAINSDFNTGGFSYRITEAQSVALHSNRTNVQYALYESLGFRRMLPALTEALGKAKSAGQSKKVEGSGHAQEISNAQRKADAGLEQDSFWPHLGTFLQDGDVILAETGTSLFGILDVKFPPNVTFIGQVLYGSIGYTGGAVLGAAIAAQKAGRRTILCIGDGSMQLTVQEVGTLIRHGLKPIILLLNNDGYVIERQIHGENRVYNDIGRWRWQRMLDFFGADGSTSQSHLVKTNAEFDALWSDASFSTPDKLQFVELIFGPHDSPRALREQAKMTEKVNAE